LGNNRLRYSRAAIRGLNNITYAVFEFLDLFAGLDVELVGIYLAGQGEGLSPALAYVNAEL
jgi:hypothetical protein